MVLIQSSDAVVVIGGRYGTLSEIAAVSKTGITGAGYLTWEIPEVISCGTPEEAVRKACSAAALYRKNRTRQDP
jgi:predicted Rossmann-fold nucleotide-binding protein